MILESKVRVLIAWNAVDRDWACFNDLDEATGMAEAYVRSGAQLVEVWEDNRGRVKTYPEEPVEISDLS